MNRNIKNLLKHNGSSLIECLTYCASCMLIFSLTLQWVLKSQLFLKNQCLKSNNAMSSLAAQSLLIRELEHAPNEKNKWKNTNEHLVVWTQGQDDIGWQFEKGKLIRYQGEYSKRTAQWIHATKSTINLTVKNFAIQFRSQRLYDIDWITHAIITYDNQTTVVVLHNRVIS